MAYRMNATKKNDQPILTTTAAVTKAVQAENVREAEEIKAGLREKRFLSPAEAAAAIVKKRAEEAAAHNTMVDKMMTPPKGATQAQVVAAYTAGQDGAAELLEQALIRNVCSPYFTSFPLDAGRVEAAQEAAVEYLTFVYGVTREQLGEERGPAVAVRTTLTGLVDALYYTAKGRFDWSEQQTAKFGSLMREDRIGSAEQDAQRTDADDPNVGLAAAGMTPRMMDAEERMMRAADEAELAMAAFEGARIVHDSITTRDEWEPSAVRRQKREAGAVKVEPTTARPTAMTPRQMELRQRALRMATPPLRSQVNGQPPF